MTFVSLLITYRNDPESVGVGGMFLEPGRPKPLPYLLDPVIDGGP